MEKEKVTIEVEFCDDQRSVILHTKTARLLLKRECDMDFFLVAEENTKNESTSKEEGNNNQGNLELSDAREYFKENMGELEGHTVTPLILTGIILTMKTFAHKHSSSHNVISDKTIDQKAEEYANNVHLDKNTYRGDVVTAYVVGASEQRHKQPSDEQIQRWSEEVHPKDLGAQVRFCEQAEWLLSKLQSKELHLLENKTETK